MHYCSCSGGIHFDGEARRGSLVAVAAADDDIIIIIIINEEISLLWHNEALTDETGAS